MKEKYIKANLIKDFIKQLKLEAIKEWDIDAIIACNRIEEKIDDTIGVYICSS